MAKRILIAEDDPGYQELMRLVCEGYELTITPSSEQALAQLEAGSFDLVISDINLYGMSGLEFLRQLKAKGLLERSPAVICSSEAGDHAKQAAMDLGAAGFVAKPFEPRALRLLIQDLLA